MSPIVKQFRALKCDKLIYDTYRRNDQRFAASIINDCIRCADDEKLLEMLRKHAFTFVNSLQSFSPETLPEWREFLIELINDVTAEKARSYDSDGYPEWADESQQLIAHTRIGKRANFYILHRLIMDGISRLPIVASFASDCKNIVAVGKMLPNIMRDLIEKNSAVTNVVLWLNLVEIYTRQYQGRVLYHREKYPELIAHLAKYKCASEDVWKLFYTKTVDRNSVAYAHTVYFLTRIARGDLHLAATFLCDNIGTIAQFCYMYNKAELSFWFEKSVKLAALVLNEETEMNSKIQQIEKPVVSADLGRKLGDLLKESPEKLNRMTERVIEKDIDELITNLKQAREQLAQMRDAAAKLRATINKSKKLIADWEC